MIENSEIEHENQQRIEAEKEKIDNEINNLFKIAEAKADVDLDDREAEPLKISQREIDEITAESRVRFKKEFEIMLQEEKQKLDKQNEEVEIQISKLQKTYSKKAANREKEFELELTKQIRDIAKTSKETVKLEKVKLDAQLRIDKEQQKKDLKSEVTNQISFLGRHKSR